MPQPNGPAGPTAPERNWTAVLLLGWISAIKATGISMSAVAIVQATRALDLTPTTRAVAASATSLAIAATAVAAGVAADRLGRRRVLMASFLIAGAGSVVAALAPTPGLYIAALAVCGVGFGVMFTGSYAYMKVVAPGKALGWALGLFGLFTSVLASAASIMGAALGSTDWRLLFLVVPVMCVVGLVLVPRVLPVMPRVGSGSVDYVGLVILGLGMVLLIEGITGLSGAISASGAGVLAAGLIAMACWVWRERTARNPAFPLGLFRSGSFVGAAIVGIILNIASVAAVLGLTDVWQYLAGESVLGVTSGLQPLYLVGTIGGLVAGHRLSAGASPRVVVAIGMSLTALGFLAMLPLQADSPYWLFVPAIALTGMGMAASITAQAQVIIHAAPADDYGAVTSSKTSIGQVGSALGMVFAVMFVDRSFDLGLLATLQSQGVSPSAAQESLTTVESYIRGSGTVTDASLASDAVASLMASVHQLALTTAVLVALGAVLTWRLMRTPAAAAAAADASA